MPPIWLLFREVHYVNCLSDGANVPISLAWTKCIWLGCLVCGWLQLFRSLHFRCIMCVRAVVLVSIRPAKSTLQQDTESPRCSSRPANFTPVWPQDGEKATKKCFLLVSCETYPMTSGSLRPLVKITFKSSLTVNGLVMFQGEVSAAAVRYY